jgi:GNAT superfamily N-acetyltransferase
MEITVRQARNKDIDAMTGLLGELFAIEADFSVNPDHQRRGLALMLDGCGKHRCLLVAEIEGRVVGMCSAQLLVSTAEGGMVALVEDVVVAQHHRKMGIGRRLMNRIEAWSREHGALRLQLLADRTNFTALDFYNTLGWHPTRLMGLRRKWNVST